MRVKICGLTRAEDVEAALDAGADAVGFVLEPTSRRCVTMPQFDELARLAGPYCATVAVYGNAGPPYPRAQAYQAHGFSSLPPGLKIMTHRLGTPPVGDVDAYHLDYLEGGFGGSGKTIDWEAAAAFVRETRMPVILAGGLTPRNVAEAISIVHPYAVDVSSGVEGSPGVKDRAMIREFVQAAKGAV